jgi:hypothetical protein
LFVYAERLGYLFTGGFVVFVDDLFIDFEGLLFVCLRGWGFAELELQDGAWLLGLFLGGLFVGVVVGFFLFFVVAEVNFRFGCFAAAGGHDAVAFTADRAFAIVVHSYQRICFRVLGWSRDLIVVV